MLAATPNQSSSGQSQACSYFDSRRNCLHDDIICSTIFADRKTFIDQLARSQGYLLSAYTIETADTSGFTMNQPYRLDVFSTTFMFHLYLRELLEVRVICRPHK